MRVKFELIGSNKIVLPFSHSHILQGLVYNFLEDKAADWLHSEGFKYEKRSFKMFVFSDILERAQLQDRDIGLLHTLNKYERCRR